MCVCVSVCMCAGLNLIVCVCAGLNLIVCVCMCVCRTESDVSLGFPPCGAVMCVTFVQAYMILMQITLCSCGQDSDMCPFVFL